MSRGNVAATQQKTHNTTMWHERVLYIDGEALVIDKPAGLAVHAGPRTRDSLEDHLDHLRFGFMRAPTPVHRLDRDTSGCLLLARNPKAHKRFQRAFEAGGGGENHFANPRGGGGGGGGGNEAGPRKGSPPESGRGGGGRPPPRGGGAR